VAIEKFHCADDALTIVEMNRPAVAVLSELSKFEPVVTEGGQPLARILRWQLGGLSLESRSVPIGGGLVCSALAIGRNPAAIASSLDSLIEQTTDRAHTAGGKPRSCTYGFRRFLWSLIACSIFLIPAIFIPGSLAFAFTPDPVPLLVITAAAVVATYALTRWGQHNRLQQQREVWGLFLAQGDNDGTIRRALASIGIELSEETPPAS
jgi:hypothetical protein